MNQSFLQHISIQNFKSIQSCKINNCSRINLFIGRPNVGKSNIIEALSLFSITFLKENTSKKLTNLVRLENELELFYKGEVKYEALIKTNYNSIEIHYKESRGISFDFHHNSIAKTIYNVDEKLNVKSGGYLNHPIKRYTFNPNVSYKRSNAKYLIPPYGFNLLNIIKNYNSLKQEVIDLFKEYDLTVAFDRGSQTLKILQSKKDDNIFLIPYSSIANTLQRLIFFKAAIASNNNSVLLFEEPEAHSFPPYMSKLTQDIINKKDNQFFVATHSPYILNDLLENAQDELSIYMVGYVDKQTIVKQLTELQLHDIHQYGVDLFTNSESFI